MVAPGVPSRISQPLRYLKMASPRSIATPTRIALEPQRRPGKQRVAELMRAGAEVIAERGYEAATMAEIAARAGAPIGSLYRFFPNKDALADALIGQYGELIDAAFEKIDSRPEILSTDAFADALLDSMVALRGQTQAAVVELLDRHPDSTARRSEFHDSYLRHIVRVLKERDSRLSAKQAADMAVALLQNMKAVKMLDAESNAGVIAELRAMTRLYLASKLGSEGVASSRARNARSSKRSAASS
jgi:AcrR family transcriptional regulator